MKTLTLRKKTEQLQQLQAKCAELKQTVANQARTIESYAITNEGLRDRIRAIQNKIK